MFVTILFCTFLVCYHCHSFFFVSWCSLGAVGEWGFVGFGDGTWFSTQTTHLWIDTSFLTNKAHVYAQARSHPDLKVADQKPESKTNKDFDSGESGGSKSGDCDLYLLIAWCANLEIYLKKIITVKLSFFWTGKGPFWSYMKRRHWGRVPF